VSGILEDSVGGFFFFPKDFFLPFLVGSVFSSLLDRIFFFSEAKRGTDRIFLSYRNLFLYSVVVDLSLLGLG